VWWMDNLERFRRFLPSDLIEKAISLEDIGINEYVWEWRDALMAIDILVKKRVFILGGDVYSRVNNKLELTGDSWHSDPPNINLLCAENDFYKSQTAAKNYINAYVDKNGEAYYFSIVGSFPV